ncbi:hypothetical protein QO009_000449 [Brevibacillus aydinogluensis]|uniref:hypothetical protein n=1 Tax=Brevibacillus aydinogluensis TaxID=927786 RepID=UPI00289348CE|nr:hypothetical protein [Brevibacillus aydinogluensis]MDT3414605.1 hypothetical protein [Brevibacillus aydinogluensis]
MNNPPKGIVVNREFEPDMERMVQALKVVLEAPVIQPSQDSLADEASVREESA